MIKPTIGRVVLVFNRLGSVDPANPEPALIARVWGDRLINVGGFDANGQPFSHTSLSLSQDDDVYLGPHAQWMPYQKGQAIKHEALEIAAAARAAGPSSY